MAGTLKPAIDQYMRNPTRENWRIVSGIYSQIVPLSNWAVMANRSTSSKRAAVNALKIKLAQITGSNKGFLLFGISSDTRVRAMQYIMDNVPELLPAMLDAKARGYGDKSQEFAMFAVGAAIILTAGAASAGMFSGGATVAAPAATVPAAPAVTTLPAATVPAVASAPAAVAPAVVPSVAGAGGLSSTLGSITSVAKTGFSIATTAKSVLAPGATKPAPLDAPQTIDTAPPVSNRDVVTPPAPQTQSKATGIVLTGLAVLSLFL